LSPEERLKGLKAGDRIGRAWPGYAAVVFLRDGMRNGQAGKEAAEV